MKKTAGELKRNYLVIESWMVNELKLKGNSLLLYALIYGFSQTEKQVCTCGIDYMRAWTNSSKQGVLNALDQLIQAGLVERVYDVDSDGRIAAYRAIGQESLPNSQRKTGQESLPNASEKGQQSVPKKGQESLPNPKKKVNKVDKLGQQSCRATDNNNNYNIFFVDEKELSKLLGTTIDCEPAHSLEEYKQVAAELERSKWARKNFTHLSKIHCNWDRLVSGYYRDRIDSVANAESYSAADLNAIFNQISEDEI